MKIYKSKSMPFVFKVTGYVDIEAQCVCIVSSVPGDNGYWQEGQKFTLSVNHLNEFIEITFQQYLKAIENDN